MFMGESLHSLDAKGRITVPAKFREGLGAGFVATRGLDGCIFLYPMSEWKELEEKVRNMPLTKADARSFARFFFAGASELEMDRQGRILLTQTLREHAEIEKDVSLIGVDRRVEVWAADRWESYSNVAEQSFEKIAENLDVGF
ncbi:MAG: division/cell wall cluster transcriptional repressor MraZ [Syntrophomonadaceae bacterium]|nr:division/cell wall cluster transcriptional repressor MraZ [Syntrophomonadaceae bacterium]